MTREKLADKIIALLTLSNILLGFLAITLLVAWVMK